MKDAKIIIALIVITLMLNGCKRPDPNYKTPEETAADQITIILESVINKDTKSIEELFCPYIKENHPDLEGEILALFEFIEGEIISYDEAIGKISAWSSTAEDGYVERAISGEIENIKTSVGKTYSIGYGSYLVYKENPEYEGITSITVFDEDMRDPMNGYPDEAKFVIHLPELWDLVLRND